MTTLPDATTPSEWFHGKDTTPSSLTIYSVMTGEKSRSHGIPSSPIEFDSCHRLLLHFPEWEANLAKVSEKHPDWTPFVREWSELTRLFHTPGGAAIEEFLRKLETLTTEASDCMDNMARFLVHQGQIGENVYNEFGPDDEYSNLN